jgi:hypothetical protein
MRAWRWGDESNSDGRKSFGSHTEFPRTAAHRFYEQLYRVLEERGFDAVVEQRAGYANGGAINMRAAPKDRGTMRFPKGNAPCTWCCNHWLLGSGSKASRSDTSTRLRTRCVAKDFATAGP